LADAASELQFNDSSAFDPVPSLVPDLEADVRCLSQNLADAKRAGEQSEAAVQSSARPMRQKIERIVGIIKDLVSDPVIDPISDKGSDYDDEDSQPYVGKPDNSSSDSTDSLPEPRIPPKYQMPVTFDDLSWNPLDHS
jgi:hypothetical protein